MGHEAINRASSACQMGDGADILLRQFQRTQSPQRMTNEGEGKRAEQPALKGFKGSLITQ